MLTATPPARPSPAKASIGVRGGLTAPIGAIPTQWHITGYPSLFLIDAQGVIRHRNLSPGPELEHALEALLREVP